MTIEDYLQRNAERYPDKVAAVCGCQQMTWRQLYDAACERAVTLPKGEVITFRCPQSTDFLISYFAIHLAGSVAVPLEKDLPEPLFRQITSNLPCS